MVEPISDADVDRLVNKHGRVAVGCVFPAEVESMAARIRKDAVEVAAHRARTAALEAERDALKVLAEEASVWKDKAIRLEAQLRTATDWKSRVVYPSRVLTPAPPMSDPIREGDRVRHVTGDAPDGVVEKVDLDGCEALLFVRDEAGAVVITNINFWELAQ